MTSYADYYSGRGGGGGQQRIRPNPESFLATNRYPQQYQPYGHQMSEGGMLAPGQTPVRPDLGYQYSRHNQQGIQPQFNFQPQMYGGFGNRPGRNRRRRPFQGYRFPIGFPQTGQRTPYGNDAL